MSTRANIIIKEGKEKLFFYRHSDGYPSGTMPTLNIFLKWLKEGKIRNNVSQGAGWLIVLGAMEYAAIPEHTVTEIERYGRKSKDCDIETIKEPTYWKCGAYEPTTGLHGNIEYLYTIDLRTNEITVQSVSTNYDTGKQTFTDIPASELVNE